jgi:hypothetical protein
MQQARGGAETKAWDDLMKGLIAKKDSDSYKSTVETLNEAIDKYVRDPNNAYTKFTGAELHKLKKEVLEFFKYKAYGFDARDDGDGVVSDPTVDPSTRPADAPIKSGLEVKGFWEDPAFLVQNLEKEADLDAILQVGALARAEAIEQPDRPGRAGGKKVAAIASAKKRDPEYILGILEKARYSYPQFGPRIEVLIRKLKTLIDKQKNLLPAPPSTGDPELTGLLNRPGMLQMFNSGQELDYSPEAVRARTEGMARPEELA